jgi:CSLREA domain-containing protein
MIAGASSMVGPVERALADSTPVVPCPTPGQSVPIEELPCYRNQPDVVSLVGVALPVSGGFQITVTFHWEIDACVGTFGPTKCVVGPGTDELYTTCPDGLLVPCASVSFLFPFPLGCGYQSGELQLAWWDPARSPGYIFPNVHQDVGYPYDLGPCPGDPPRPPPPSPDLIVNSTADTSDASAADGFCDVDLVTAENQCTLRAAIQESNARQEGGAGDQTITFNVPGGGVPTIAPQSALPDVKGTVTIDGTTQPGGWVELNGANAGATTNGLNLTGEGSKVKGLVINRFKAAGVRAAGTGFHKILGNRIGTDAAGMAALGNEVGIKVVANSVSIGDNTDLAGTELGNLISGNAGTSSAVGVECDVPCSLAGNVIGLAADGTTAIPNRVGILIHDCASVGHGQPRSGNVVSGNTAAGIDSDCPYTNRLTAIQDSLIGTSRDGSIAVGNGGPGIIARGQSSIANNVIAANGGDGIRVEDSHGVFVRSKINDNIIGLLGDRTTAAGNNGFGIVASTSASSSSERADVRLTVDGNLIASNTKAGIKISGLTAVLGVAEEAARSTANFADRLVSISFNVIGVDAASQARPNQWGVDVTGLANVLIHGNDVAGNGLGGIHLATAYADVTSNYIGQVSGLLVSLAALPGAVPNSGPGVLVQGDDNVIGEGPLSLADSAGSFAFGPVSNHFGPNSGSAVIIGPSADSEGSGNTVRDNSFPVTNDLPPIDLSTTEAGDGKTANPPGSTGTRSGPNNLLPKPTLISQGARRIDGVLSVQGELTNLSSWGVTFGKYAIDVYSANGCPSPTEYSPIGFVTTSVLEDGEFNFQAAVATASVAAVAVTATAPEKLLALSGDTSEISACEPVLDGSAMSSDAHAGDSEVNVNSPGTFKVGDKVIVDPDGSHPETATLTGHGSIILDRPLAFDHPAGAVVIKTGSATASPYALKQGAAKALTALIPTGWTPSDKLLKKAIKRINSSLAQWRWVGDDALSPLHGLPVFSAERKAVRLLTSPLFLGNASVSEAISNLVAADRLIVLKAIDVETTASDSRRAATRLARADALIAQGNYAKAINSLKRAWLAVT